MHRMVDSVVCSHAILRSTHPSLICAGEPSAGLTCPTCRGSPSLQRFTHSHSWLRKPSVCEPGMHASTACVSMACAQAQRAQAWRARKPGKRKHG